MSITSHRVVGNRNFSNVNRNLANRNRNFVNRIRNLDNGRTYFSYGSTVLTNVDTGKYVLYRVLFSLTEEVNKGTGSVKFCTLRKRESN